MPSLFVWPRFGTYPKAPPIVWAAFGTYPEAPLFVWRRFGTYPEAPPIVWTGFGTSPKAYLLRLVTTVYLEPFAMIRNTSLWAANGSLFFCLLKKYCEISFLRIVF